MADVGSRVRSLLLVTAVQAGVVWAFVQRGLLTYASYRAKVSLGLVSLVVSVLTFSFVGRVVAAAGPGFVARYGMSYESFVIVGVLVHTVASAGLGSFRSAVRREQLQGTFEVLLTSRLSAPAVVVLAGAGELVLVAIGGLALLGVAALVVGFRLPLSASLVGAVLLYSLAMCGAGLASAGVILVSKEGDPISWVFSAASGLLGGVYFPVDVLPPWLQSVAAVLPTTHALALARAGVSSVSSPGATRSLAYLAVWALASLSLGLAILAWGFRRAKKAGTLGEY
jgi:ABC-2 type transport system permease protein